MRPSPAAATPTSRSSTTSTTSTAQPADVSQRRRLRDLVGGRQLGLRLTRAGLHLPGENNQNPLQAYDGYGNPVNFTGSAPYIVGNTITGRPTAPSPGNPPAASIPSSPEITVDSHGNIWVTDAEKGELDEFAPSGLFIKRITAESSGVPPDPNPSVRLDLRKQRLGGFVGFGGIAVDPTNGRHSRIRSATNSSSMSSPRQGNTSATWIRR